ncbi:hypothetical protein [Streptomyces sp. V3I7]|uniref:hypothetical protein n=1 Tax=Streptomyces sp. V3I7 TaxID=3042278 RepID=UPI0027808D11|nr:hypothetical protein [Streptomyces sp. V3I7]MDQ0990791.1 hypothetical protein [Streptomyces sp. V3I7]
MRRTARLLTGTALAVVAAGLGAAPACAVGAGSLEVFPSSVVPGYQVTVNTKACGGQGAATGDAGAVGAGTFTLAPSAHEGDAIGQFRVPSSAQPGTYEIVARCAQGGREVTGDLVVALSTAGGQVQPRGSLKTGVGGSALGGPGSLQTTAGVAALAVAAAGGTWLLHRRARGDGI